jgi:hypothetical protein
MDLTSQIVFFFFVFILISISYLIYITVFREPYTNKEPAHIVFLTKDETSDFLMGDSDQYMRNLSDYDLKARNVESVTTYQLLSASKASDFTEDEKIILSQAVLQADGFFATLYKNKRIAGLDPQKIIGLPWVFAKTDGNTYEGGLPHTRLRLIFLTGVHLKTDLTILTKLVIHEKLHVYQRYYWREVQEYIESIDCHPQSERRIYPFIRANPDLNKWVYVCSTQSHPTYYEYASHNPKGISDIKRNDIIEHPYEDMAYYVASKYGI